MTQPCSETVRFDIPYPAGATVKVEIGGREVASEEIRVRDLLVVGMGDSIGSGEGNPDVPVRFSRERAASYGKRSAKIDLSGYPARVGPWKQIGDKAFIEENPRWSDQACHRSLYSHQLRAALQLGIEDPHRAVTYVGVACSGAEVTFGLFLRYTGNEWVPNPPDLSQISAVASAQCGDHEAPLQDLPEAYHMDGTIPELKGGLVLRKCDPLNARKIDLLLLSVGGNDVGFSRLLANAVLADQSLLRKLGGWIGQVHGLNEASAQLDALILRYKSLNRAIHYILHIPWEESDRVLLTAYPGLALLGDGSEVCPDGRAGMEVLSDFKMSEAKATRRHLDRRQAQSRHAGRGERVSLDVRRQPPPRVHRARHLRGHDLRRRQYRRRSAPAAQDRGGLASLQPGRLQGLCLAPALVPHAQRCVHDRQLPRRGLDPAESVEAQGAVVVPAGAGRDLLGRLSPDGGRAGGDRRRRRHQRARRARQVRQGPGRAMHHAGAHERAGSSAHAAIVALRLRADTPDDGAVPSCRRRAWAVLHKLKCRLREPRSLGRGAACQRQPAVEIGERAQRRPRASWRGPCPCP